MKRFHFVVVALAAVSIGVGCSSASEEPSASSSEPLAEFCNTNAQRGHEVYTYDVARDMPHGRGGTVRAGTYVMVARTVYTGEGGHQGKSVGPFQVTIINQAGADGEPNGNQQLTIHAPVLPTGYVMQPGEQFHANAWFKTPGGNTFQSAHTCPDTMPVPFSEFTAAGNLWQVFDFVNHQVWTLWRIGD